LNIGTLTLASPASGSTVPAPPTFNWTVSGLITPKVYLANKANPVFAVDTIVIFNNSAGTTFTPSLSEWTTAVNALGIATNYYWTLGNSDPAAKQIYADWRPFKTQPGTINPIFLSENKHFRFQLVSPHLPQITIQTSPNLTTWTDFITLQNTSGVVTYTDQTVGSQEKKFFRVKP
jgi:hypothetical protein